MADTIHFVSFRIDITKERMRKALAVLLDDHGLPYNLDEDGEPRTFEQAFSSMEGGGGLDIARFIRRDGVKIFRVLGCANEDGHVWEGLDNLFSYGEPLSHILSYNEGGTTRLSYIDPAGIKCTANNFNITRIIEAGIANWQEEDMLEQTRLAQGFDD